MSNTIKIIVVAAVVVLAAGGAYMALNKEDASTDASQTTNNATEQTSEPAEQPKDEVLTVDGAIAELKEAGLTVGEKQGAFYDMIGAENGDKVEVDGTVIEMYEFSTAQEAQEAVTQLEGGDDTTYAKGTFVVLIHSTDQAVVSKIRNIL